MTSSKDPQHADKNPGFWTKFSIITPRKTAIALSVITCLFMSILAFEIIQEHGDTKKEVQEEQKDQSQWLYKMLALNDEKQLAPQIHFSHDKLHDLQEENQRLTLKIKVLRNELLETKQRLYEIKPNLFVKQNPIDSAKIFELNQQLIEKEEGIYNLSKQIKSLENALAESQNSTHKMDRSIEALTHFLDAQKNQSQEDLQKFKLQNLELEEFAAKKEALMQTLADFSIMQEQLAQSIEEQKAQVNVLQKQKVATFAIFGAKSAFFRYNELQSPFVNHQVGLLMENLAQLSEVHALAQVLESDNIQNLKKEHAQETQLMEEIKDLVAFKSDQLEEQKLKNFAWLNMLDLAFASYQKVAEDKETTSQYLRDALLESQNQQAFSESLEEQLKTTSEKISQLANELAWSKHFLENKEADQKALKDKYVRDTEYLNKKIEELKEIMLNQEKQHIIEVTEVTAYKENLKSRLANSKDRCQIEQNQRIALESQLQVVQEKMIAYERELDDLKQKLNAQAENIPYFQ